MDALDEDTKENIIRNIGELFPNVSDLSFFRQVFDNENWDLERSLETIKSFLEYVEKDAPVDTSSTNGSFHRSSVSNDTFRSQPQLSSGPNPRYEVKRVQYVPVTTKIIGSEPAMLPVNTGTVPKMNAKGANKKPDSALKNTSTGSSSSWSSINKTPASTGTSAKGNTNIESKKAALGSKASRKEQLLRVYNDALRRDNPIHRITTYALENIRVMVIIRGCPGSGKTYLVQQLATNLSREQAKVQGVSQISPVDHHIFSADDFWINPKTDKYVFNAEYIEYAHRWNQKLVRQAASEGRSPIFVDNTHTRLWEMQAAATIAVEFGYIIEIIEAPNKWRFNIDELVRKNSHGVHRDAIRRMVERYERHVTPSQLISNYRLTYPPNFQPPQKCLVTFSTQPSKNQTKIFNGRFHCVPLSQVLALKAEGSESSGSAGEQANANVKHAPQKQLISDKPRKQPTASESSEHFGLFGSEMVDSHMNSPQFFPAGNYGAAQQLWFPQQNLNREPSQPAVGGHSTQFQRPNQDLEPNFIPSPHFWSVTDHQRKRDTVDSLLTLDEDMAQNMSAQLLPHPERASVPLLPVHCPVSSQPRLVEDPIQVETLRQPPNQASDDLLMTFEEIAEDSLKHSESDTSVARLVSSDYESSVSPCEEAFSDESQLDSDDTSSDSCEKLPLPQDACNEFGERITPEYVLVGPDGRLTFQYAHKGDPSFLKDFKISSKMLSKANKLVVAKTLRNFVGRQNRGTGNSLVSKVSNAVSSPFKKSVDGNHSYHDLALGCVGANARDSFSLSKSVSFPGASTRSSDQPEVESVLDLTSAKMPRASFWDSLGDTPQPTTINPSEVHQETGKRDEISRVFSSWIENPESDTPKMPVRSNSPKQQRNCVSRTSLHQQFGSNTNYKDFEVLTKVNAGVEVDPEYVILIGNAFSFVSATTPPRHSIKLVATHDKSSTTVSEMPTVVEKDSGVGILTKMFPDVSVDCLIDLFEKCHKDLDWTVNQMMDSGQEVSANFVADSKVRPEPFDFPHNSVPGSLDVETSDCFQDQATNSAPSSQRKNRKNKKLTEEYSDLVKEFESSFVLNEEYYSETLRKVKETKFGKPNESGPLDEQCVSRDSTPSNDQDTSVSDILEDDEGDMSLVMSKDLISQLQNSFGPIPNSYGSDLVVKLPVSLARQIYSYALDSICQQVEEQQNVFDFLIKEDEAFARQLQELPAESSGTMSFQEIMDHEVALRTYQNQQKASDANGGGETFASKLSHQLLAERFPDMDPTTLQNVLDVTNHSLHQATNLLSFAGHVPVEPQPQEPQKSSRTEPTYEMSREESIDQANAYHEVAARLNDMRQLYFQKAKESYNNGNHAVALFYRELFNWYSDRIKESNSMAAKAMLYGNEGATTLDLHFLLVAEAVRVLDLFLDESIRRLSGRKLEIFIITGRGLHSADGKSRIKPAIKNRLKQRGLKFGEVNPGMLKTVITKTSTVSYKLNGVQ